MSRKISIDEVTERAVRAALAIVDEATEGTSQHSAGPCGDALAHRLHETIESALAAHFESDLAPAFVTCDY